jgi:glutamyl-tRNA synthetase
VFDLDKLGWLNGHYIRELTVDDLAARLVPFLVADGLIEKKPSAEDLALLRAAVPLVQERIDVLAQGSAMLGFLFTGRGAAAFEVDPDDANRLLGPDSVEVLEATLSALRSVGEGEWRTDRIEAALRKSLVDKMGMKPKLAFAAVRVAITGRRVSPPLFESMELLGRDSTMGRLTAAAQLHH